MQPVTVSVSSVEAPDVLAAPVAWSSYLGVAEGLMPGVRALASAGPHCALALTLVCAHALECLLKSFVARVRSSDAALREAALRHDLSALWQLACSEGLAVAAQPPDWVTHLSRLHKPPYYARYAPGVHAVVLPAPEPMTGELAALLSTVRGAVHQCQASQA